MQIEFTDKREFKKKPCQLGLLFLSKVCESEDSKEFLKEKIDLANKLAYGVVKNRFLDEDIRQMIPDDLNFDNYM